MRSALTFLFSLLVILAFFSCGKENSVNNAAATASTTTTSTTSSSASLTVTTDKAQITADGADKATFNVKDNTNADVTASSIIFVADKPLTSNTFSTTIAGNYLVRASKGSLASGVISLSAISPPVTSTGGNTSGTGTGVTVNGTFTQKTLAEFFTGTWCGLCPPLLIDLESYTNANPNTIMVGIHGPAGSPDPFQYVYESQLWNAFGIFDQPNILLNRANIWDDYDSSLDVLAKNTAVLGVGLATTVSGSTISVNVSVKYGLTITAPLKLVVYLVEDGIPYDQVNFGYLGLPNPIPNFVHRNILRTAATDILGDAMPAAQQTSGNTWQKAYTFDASKYQVSRCKVVAFVMYDANSSGLKGVLNSQIVNAGQSVSY